MKATMEPGITLESPGTGLGHSTFGHYKHINSGMRAVAPFATETA
jgi:hypothetical protein